MNQSIAKTIFLSLLCFYSWNAHAAPGPLDRIDGRLISENFPVEGGIAVDPGSPESQSTPECSQLRSFGVVESGVPGQIVVTLCQRGEFGPANIEATLAKEIAEAKKSFKNWPAPAAHSILAGLEPMTVPLEGGAQGKALTLPYAGHGLALIPLAYALTPGKDASIVVQAYLNPNAPRQLTKEIAALLQGIYKRLRQDKAP